MFWCWLSTRFTLCMETEYSLPFWGMCGLCEYDMCVSERAKVARETLAERRRQRTLATLKVWL